MQKIPNFKSHGLFLNLKITKIKTNQCLEKIVPILRTSILKQILQFLDFLDFLDLCIRFLFKYCQVSCSSKNKQNQQKPKLKTTQQLSIKVRIKIVIFFFFVQHFFSSYYFFRYSAALILNNQNTSLYSIPNLTYLQIAPFNLT